MPAPKFQHRTINLVLKNILSKKLKIFFVGEIFRKLPSSRTIVHYEGQRQGTLPGGFSDHQKEFH